MFPNVRERAIKRLSSRLEKVDAFDLIVLAIKYDVQQWLKPTYQRIAKRTELITHAEARKVSFPIAVMLMRLHEQCSGGKEGIEAIVQTEVRLMEKNCP